MHSASEKFLLALELSDEGIEMMIQRVVRQNPGLSKSQCIEKLRLELEVQKNKALPKDLIPKFPILKRE